ncbi:Lrp/AsnC family transcriptional regulator [Algimonas porphyrae]|uniref:AsnC family transcriptional regulator n=1 Tax=Algimonas porphyrae TaxID=1128113 RepID=A0ABQ5UVN4_9PROT|nr:Lrp/AsnC family transcriptional regulator [Algimonas porphyrae]GLQ19323.1 AsnC family transcriptional regulator [Algimonas porphyrae]
MHKLDLIDRKILMQLQRDASQSIQAIAAQVGLTSNPCWRRIKRLEEAGIISGRVARVDPMAMGLKMTCFVTLHTEDHSEDWLRAFNAAMQKIPEVVECHRMTGDVDYLMKILAYDLEHYDEIYRKLIRLVPGLNDVSSAFSMERLKDGHIIPVDTEF